MSLMPRGCLVLALLLLVACMPRGTKPPVGPDQAQALAAQSAREAELADVPAWSLAGRLAVSMGGEGGTGRIEWRQQGEEADIELTAPVTRQGWRLRVRPGHARLEGLEGGPLEGRDPEVLLQEATGWRLPIHALSAWVRGARAAGPARIEFDAAGLPLRIEQSGWEVEYRAWDTGEPARPKRVFARRGDASVRLVVDRWGEP